MGRKEEQTLVDESWTKFVELWTCGKSATFHVECWNGEARLHFSTLLGKPEGLKKTAESAGPTLFSTTEVKTAESAVPTLLPTTKAKSQKKYSPSKLKRNQLRLQAFLEKKIQESCNDTTESTDQNEQILEDEKVRQESCADIVEMDLI